MNHFSHIRNQHGGVGAGFIFAGVIFFVLGYFFFYPNFIDPKDVPKSNTCYITKPDPKKDITFQGVRYVQLRVKTPTIGIEVESHLAPIGKVEDADGVEREGFIPWLDGFGGGVGDPTKPGTPKIYPVVQGNDLLFLDVGTAQTTIPLGHMMLDMYRKADKPIPDFIVEYCKKFPNIGPLSTFQDTYAQSFPPLSFNSDELNVEKIVIDIPKQNTEYRLVAWEPFTERISLSPKGSPYVTSGIYPALINNEKVSIPFNYVAASPALFISLFDPDGFRQYDYLPAKFATASPTVIDLHKKAPIQKDTVQLEAFLPFQIPAWGWWVPECKPAVYLYPEKEQLVNVQVSITDGFLTYTDPLYPKKGWNVLAKPSGQLQYLNNNFVDSKGQVNYGSGIFPYLYYEGKVADTVVKKPEEGYVIAYDNLESVYDELLPKLGLNAKETKEFKMYWLQALPRSPYYFIGLIPQEELNINEPLTITPKEDTMIRVRLYFEALDKPKSVEAPHVQTPTRNGFTVVDWGGMVKADKDHPFTCLQ